MTKIALIGLGTVGQEVARLLIDEKEAIRERTGAELELSVIVDKDLSPREGLSIPSAIPFTDDAVKVTHGTDIDIVVELIGGDTIAKDFHTLALENGKHVVTANKALLAVHGRELMEAADKAGKQLRYEASICGGIPIIKSIKESMGANKIERLYGIINGTANYILSSMTHKGMTFDQALKDAQKLGLAEADPTFDIEGTDTAHKLVLLCQMAFGKNIPFSDLSYEGISKLSPLDIEYAGELGFTIKLLAVAVLRDNSLEARAHPTLIPNSHPLASVENEFNAISIVGDRTGEMMFYGKGAGGRPTASAIVSDIIDIALGRVSGNTPDFGAGNALVKNEDFASKNYLRLTVEDQPGVLGEITTLLGNNNISIDACIQKGKLESGAVPIVLQTFESREVDTIAAVEQINKLSFTREPTQRIRVESLD